MQTFAPKAPFANINELLLACRTQLARSIDARRDLPLSFLSTDTIKNMLIVMKLSAEPKNDAQIRSTVCQLEKLLGDDGGKNAISRL